MNNKFAYFEKYSVAPSPSRDYYGIKILNNEVILHHWKISHGPHLLPVVRVIKFSEIGEDKLLRDEIKYIFGSYVSDYLELLVFQGNNTLLTLPKNIIEKLIKYLNLTDIARLLCVSQICNEIFNTSAVWEVLYKRLMKGSSKLTEMERNADSNQSFKKLVKDQHIRNVAKKNLKLMEDKSARSQKLMDTDEKMLQSVNMPRTTLKNNNNNVRKQSIDDSSKKINKIVKSQTGVSTGSEEKKFNLPKQNTFNEKSLFFIDTQNFKEKLGAGESYQNLKSLNGVAVRNKSNQKSDLSKFKFINENNEETELILQKKYLKSIITQSDLSDSSLDELKNMNSNTMKSPRSIFTKPSKPTLKELKLKSCDKTLNQKRSKGSKSKESKIVNSNLKNLISDNKIDDSDESGMSFLMKRYLEANNEVAKKFSECERLAHSTKDSSTQADIKEVTERKPMKKMQKCVSHTVKPMTRNTESTTNIFAKLKSVKKN